jgi:hypothetical protein
MAQIKVTLENKIIKAQIKVTLENKNDKGANHGYTKE